MTGSLSGKQPVMQTNLSIGGNCFQACLASIFECPLDEAPHLFASVTDPHEKWGTDKWNALLDWAAERGWRAFWLDPDLETDRPHIELLKSSDLFWIATGKSPRGDWGHCVVWQGSQMRHDPASNVGGNGTGEPWLYIGFIPLEAGSSLSGKDRT